jgi:hypothetical protein
MIIDGALGGGAATAALAGVGTGDGGGRWWSSFRSTRSGSMNGTAAAAGTERATEDWARGAGIAPIVTTTPTASRRAPSSRGISSPTSEGLTRPGPNRAVKDCEEGAAEFGLADAAYLASAEYEALGGEDTSPEWVAGGQGQSMVAGWGEDTSVGWTDDCRTGDLINV